MNPIIRFLARPTALPTWRYERRVILLVEVLCQVAGILAAPTRLAALVMLVGAPFAVWQVELARAARSADARKREQAAAQGVPEVELSCARQIEEAAKARQLATVVAPVVTLATSIAAAGGQSLTLALAVGFLVSAVRVAMVELYGPWRRWYRARRAEARDLVLVCAPDVARDLCASGDDLSMPLDVRRSLAPGTWWVEGAGVVPIGAHAQVVRQ